MMIIALLLMAAEPPPLQTIVRGPSVSMPPEMAPHFMSYVGCIQDRVRSDPRMPAAAAVARQVQADARTACAETRASVATVSERALARSAAYGGRKKRRQRVEAILAAFDRAPDALIDAMSSLPDPNAARLKQPDERKD